MAENKNKILKKFFGYKIAEVLGAIIFFTLPHYIGQLVYYLDNLSGTPIFKKHYTYLLGLVMLILGSIVLAFCLWVFYNWVILGTYWLLRKWIESNYFHAMYKSGNFESKEKMIKDYHLNRFGYCIGDSFSTKNNLLIDETILDINFFTGTISYRESYQDILKSYVRKKEIKEIISNE